ncbi:MAG TPA: aspartate aminotransferase family protein [Pseudonocardiaceae bacterium]
MPTRSASATELEDLDRRFIVHPHQRSDRTERQVIVRASGCQVWDAHGREMLDVMGGGNWAMQVGHGRPEIVEAVRAQTAELDYFTGFTDFTNDKAVRLAQRLVGLAPERIGKVFFTNGGSESVDTAMKAARLYHQRRGETSRTWFIARHFGYHGCTYGSGALTGWAPMQDGVGPNLEHIAKVTPPLPYHSEMYGGEDVTEFLLRELAETIDRIGPGNIAAMIGEPVIAGGGVYAPPADYWPRVRALLREHGILLIADEIVTAYGRTGAWFDSAQRGIDPDLITTAKGLTSGYAPLGAVLMTDEIGEILSGPEGFFHGHTYNGHPTCCAVALANLDIIENENLIARSLEIGEWFRAGLTPGLDLPIVGDVRVEGAMAAVELVADKATKAPIPHPNLELIIDEIRTAHGVIVRPYPNTIVLAPPLVLEEHQAQRAVQAILEVVSRVNAQGEISR